MEQIYVYPRIPDVNPLCSQKSGTVKVPLGRHMNNRDRNSNTIEEYILEIICNSPGTPASSVIPQMSMSFLRPLNNHGLRGRGCVPG